MTDLQPLSAEELEELTASVVLLCGDWGDRDRALVNRCINMGKRSLSLRWLPVSEAPPGRWLLTCRCGEKGWNFTRYRDVPGEEREWMDMAGRTTVTHHTFAAPTHFMLLSLPPVPKEGE